MAEEWDAIVVGGGNAGLAAAKALHDAGREVILLEASDRVGGRSRTGRFGNAAWYNLGTQYIGGLGTPAADLAQELGVKMRPIFEPKVAMYTKGRLVTAKSTVGFALKLPYSIPAKIGLLKAAWRLRKARAPMHKLHGDDRRKWRKETDERPFADYFDDLHPDARRFYEDITLLMTAGPADRVSAYLGLLFTPGIGEPRVEDRPDYEHLLAVEGGTAALPAAVADYLGDRVRLNATVDEIRATEDGVTVKAGAETHAAKSCVLAVTAPLVLALVPDLPTEVRAALGEIEYGSFVTMAMHTRDRGRPGWADYFHLEVEGLHINNLLNVTYFQPEAGNESALVGFAVGGSATRLLAKTDAEIEATIIADVERIFPEARGTIQETVVQRWPVGLPYWRPGGEAVRERLRGFGGPIVLAGDYLDYPNLQGAIRSGRRAAARLLEA